MEPSRSTSAFSEALAARASNFNSSFWALANGASVIPASTATTTNLMVFLPTHSIRRGRGGGRIFPPRPDTLVGVKQDASYFEDKEPVLIYIGKKLKDSLRLEEILTAANVDYGVEADEYRAGVIFRSVGAGAFFYLLAEMVEPAHEVM